MNTKDPLSKTGPEVEQELFRRLVIEARDFPRDAVKGAAVNLIVNALRQEHPTRDAAGQAFDEMFGKAKQILMDHYTSAGRVKGVFPYNQVLRPELHINVDRINGRSR